MKIVPNQTLSDVAKHRDLRFGLGLPNYLAFIRSTKTGKSKNITLGKVLALEYGKALTEEDRIPGSYPVVGSNGVVGYNNEYLIKGPSIIVGRKGSAGAVTYITQDSFPIDTTFYVRLLSKQYSTEFIYHYLKFITLSRLSLFKGVPGLNRYDAYDAYIPVIDDNEQEKILGNIRPLEAQIEQLESQLKDTQGIADVVFSEEFKIDIRKYDDLKKRKFYDIRLSNINDHKLRFNSKSNNPHVDYILQSTLGKSLSLEEFLATAIVGGTTPSYSAIKNYKVLKTINVNKDGTIDEYDDDQYVEKASVLLENGDILVTTHGEGRGKFAIYRGHEPATTDANCSIIRIKANTIKLEYLTFYLNSFIGRGLFRYLESETKSVRYMRNDDLETLPILFDDQKQLRIVDSISTQLKRRKDIENEIRVKRDKINNIIQAAIR